MTARRQRVAFLVAAPAPGGAELSIATHLASRPSWLEPRVIATREGPWLEDFRRQDVPVSVLALSSRRPPAIARFTAGLARTLQACDLLCAIGNTAVLAGLPAARLRRVPVGWYKADLVMPGGRARQVARACRGVIASSRAAGRDVAGGRTTIAYPAVRLPAALVLGPPPPVPTITCAGRLEPTKGQHHLIRAAAILTSRVPQIRLQLAGATPEGSEGYRSELGRLASELGVEVSMPGHVADVISLLRQTTVYAQPSYRDAVGRGDEAFGIALAEASWAGVPVVASRTGGITEVVRDGETGRLVPPADPQALAAAIAALLNDPLAARELGEAGARWTRERFAPEASSPVFFAALRALMD